MAGLDFVYGELSWMVVVCTDKSFVDFNTNFLFCAVHCKPCIQKLFFKSDSCWQNESDYDLQAKQVKKCHFWSNLRFSQKEFIKP